MAADTQAVFRPPASPPPLHHPRPRSPPIAFQPTSNDSMAIPQRESVSSASSIPYKAASPAPIDPSVLALKQQQLYQPQQYQPQQYQPQQQQPVLSHYGSSVLRSVSVPNVHTTNTSAHLTTAFVQSPPPDASEQAWRNFAQLQRQSFDVERASWAVERGLLDAEVRRLEQELVIVQTKLKQAELAVVDPTSFHHRAVFAAAASSSGSLSSSSIVPSPSSGSNPLSLVSSALATSPTSRATPLASGSASSSSTATSSVTTLVGDRVVNGVARLPAIRENNTPGLSLSPQAQSSPPVRGSSPPVRQPSPGNYFSSLDGAVGNPRIAFVNRTYSDDPSPMSMLTPGTMHLQEQPYSPAASTVALSPPPPEYVQHAGHTPRPADLLPAEDCGHDTPTRLGTEHNAGFGGNDDYDDYDHDEDPALKGPLILPTDPGDGNIKGASILSTLSSKLTDVAENPGAATPAVLANTLPIDLAIANKKLSLPYDSFTSIDDKQLHGPNAAASDTPNSKRHFSDPVVSTTLTAADGTESAIADSNDVTVDAGPKLKIKRSMNFGAPLGRLA